MLWYTLGRFEFFLSIQNWIACWAEKLQVGGSPICLLANCIFVFILLPARPYAVSDRKNAGMVTFGLAFQTWNP
jgi:hypothetical protein